MTNMDIVKAIGGIDEELIAESEDFANERKNRNKTPGFPAKIILPLAACLAVALIAGIGIGSGFKMGRSKETSADKNYEAGFEDNQKYAYSDSSSDQEAAGAFTVPVYRGEVTENSGEEIKVLLFTGQYGNITLNIPSRFITNIDASVLDSDDVITVVFGETVPDFSSDGEITVSSPVFIYK